LYTPSNTHLGVQGVPFTVIGFLVSECGMLLLRRVSFVGALLSIASATPSLGFWPEYEGGRKVSLLDGRWQYGVHTSKIDSMDPMLDPTLQQWTPNHTIVPMTMDAAPPGLLGIRGVAFYRRSFIQRRGPARIQFNACSFYCRVWVDGLEIGDHRAGGYVGFALDVPAVAQDTKREIVVLADNRFNKTTAPLHTGGDFWHYGGLMRSVLLHDMPLGERPWPWRAYILPVENQYERGCVNVTVKLTDHTFRGKIKLSLKFDTGDVKVVSPQADTGIVFLSMLQVPSPTIWTTTNPYLHTLTVLGEGGEGVTERFGLRWWGLTLGLQD